MVGTAVAEASGGSHNNPSYYSSHGAAHYSEPVYIKGNMYRPDVSFIMVINIKIRVVITQFIFLLQFDSNKNNDYTFVTVKGSHEKLKIDKKPKGVYVVLVPAGKGKESSYGHSDYSTHEEEDEYEMSHESPYHKEDDQLYYGSSNHKGSSYSQPTHYKEPVYKTNSYKMPSYKEPSYKTKSYKEPTYKPATYKEPSYKAHTYKEPSYKVPAYKEPTYMVPTYKQESSYKQPSHYKDERDSYYKDDQYHRETEMEDHYSKATSLIPSQYHGKGATPVIVKMTTMNNNKNVYNKQYD